MKGPNQQGARIVAVGLQILAFIVLRPVVKVGPVAEDGDPKLGHAIQRRLQFGPLQGADLNVGQVHRDTCATQSFRL
jgi:hypothetical protein